jgi:NAD dependent epimerase/dehydratase family enzyme
MAVRQANGIMVRWVTTAELNTWGFYLYRSTDGSRAGAVRVTPEIILGQGRGQGGAAYSWVDKDAQVGRIYTYWLQEVELNGTVNEYGPATAVVASSQHAVFVPVAYR